MSVPPAGSEAPAFELSGGALCLDFANTWGDRERPESDRLRDYEALLAFAVQAGALRSREAAALRRSARAAPRAGAEALAAAIRLREGIYGVMASAARGRRVPAAAVETVNAALAEALPHLRVVAHDGGFAWELAPDPRSLVAPLRAIARSAGELMTGEMLGRVRECDGAACTWLFLDESRNRSRRWCSMESCGNRAKARRHYRKRRT